MYFGKRIPKSHTLDKDHYQFNLAFIQNKELRAQIPGYFGKKYNK